MEKKRYFPIMLAAILALMALLSTGCSVPVASSASGGGEMVEILVSDVRVEIGVGSPIPVEVLVSGTWPGLCTQIAEIKQQASENQFEISLMASADTPGCPPDQVGLPFGMRIPLNMVELPYGEYAVTVNGVGTTFNWDLSQ